MTKPNHETTDPTDGTTVQTDETTIQTDEPPDQTGEAARDSSITSRRDVLKATGASVVGLAASDSAGAATPAGGPDEFNVGFAAESGRKAALNAASEVVREFDSLDVVTIRAPLDAASALENRADVRYVEENGTVQALADTLPWGVDRVDAEVAHANGEKGNGADVALLDTGIDSDHPNLQFGLGSGKSFPFPECTSPNDTCGTCHYDWDDDNGHGTQLACIIGGDDDGDGTVGVAPRVELHAVKVLNYEGQGRISDVAYGLEYVADQGWDVANMSFGTGYSSTMDDAVTYADNNGVLQVAAAGNAGPCTDCVAYPAAFPEVVAVSATNANDQLASVSSTGPEVELAAPGTNISSCTCGESDGPDWASGTSLAAPHVTAAAGMLMANGASHTQARNTLEASAEDIGLSSNEQGAGLLDVAAALGLDSSDST